MNPQAAAFANLSALNNQFSNALSPFNNYAAANLQLAVSEQRRREEAANRVRQMQFAAQLENERMREADRINDQNVGASNQFTLARDKAQSTDSLSRAREIAQMQFVMQNDALAKQQADEIRRNPDAKDVLGKRMSEFKDDREGNRALVAEFNNAMSDPSVAEKLDVTKAVAVTRQLKEAVSRLTPGMNNSPQAKQAIAEFLATPGVPEALLGDGEIDPRELAALQQNPAKVQQLIEEAASNSAFFGTDEKMLTTLQSAWYQAAAKAGAAVSPEQQVNVDYIKSLMDRRNSILKSGRISSEDGWKQLTEAQGLSTPRLPPSKVPPPAAPNRPQIQARNNTNPFAAPALPPEAEGKVGPAKWLAQGARFTPDRRNYARDVGNDSREFAFAPVPLATNPRDEFMVRKQALESNMLGSALKQGLTSMIPGNFGAGYSPHDAMRDEIAIEALVKSMYSPQIAPPAAPFAAQ